MSQHGLSLFSTVTPSLTLFGIDILAPIMEGTLS